METTFFTHQINQDEKHQQCSVMLRLSAGEVVNSYKLSAEIPLTIYSKRKTYIIFNFTPRNLAKIIITYDYTICIRIVNIWKH